ncbi:COQ9 family protein [Magnetovibrio sp. PR-2]|uniref:COQ9 family protein n=1 Tax=Magnetovibrio sp. PR-2 TaxID=3120356 RepID=UPI002FCE4CE7
MTAADRKAAREAKKDAIVLAASPHVAFDGWGDEALAAGAEDIGLDAKTAKRLFPNGATDAIAQFAQISDREMMKAMEQANVGDMRVRDRVIFGVRARLEFLMPHREAVRAGLSVLSNPLHVGLMTAITHTTVDNIWYMAGDRSADFNYYTKRGLLAPVYGATVLYWLNDESDGCEDTWDFLARRIDDVLKIPVVKSKITKALDGLLSGSPFAKFKNDLQMRP